MATSTRDDDDVGGLQLHLFEVNLSFVTTIAAATAIVSDDY